MNISSSTLRVGVVGLGPHFRETLFPALKATDAALFALCDRSVESQEWARSTISGSPLVVDSIDDNRFWDASDVVVCASSPQAHELVLAEAFKHNKPCFCEKPAGMSSKSLGKLIDEAVFHPLIRVGHVFRYAVGGKNLIELLSGQNINSFDLEHAASKPRGSRWGMNSLQAFSLSHLTHALDFIQANTGKITAIDLVAASTRDGVDTVYAQFKAERCPSVSLDATNGASSFVCNAHVLLEDRRTFKMDRLRRVLERNTIGEETRHAWSPKPKCLEERYFTEELQAFFDLVRGNGTCLLPTLEDAKDVLLILEQMEKMVARSKLT